MSNYYKKYLKYKTKYIALKNIIGGTFDDWEQEADALQLPQPPAPPAPQPPAPPAPPAPQPPAPQPPAPKKVQLVPLYPSKKIQNEFDDDNKSIDADPSAVAVRHVSKYPTKVSKIDPTIELESGVMSIEQYNRRLKELRKEEQNGNITSDMMPPVEETDNSLLNKIIFEKQQKLVSHKSQLDTVPKPELVEPVQTYQNRQETQHSDPIESYRKNKNAIDSKIDMILTSTNNIEDVNSFIDFINVKLKGDFDTSVIDMYFRIFTNIANLKLQIKKKKAILDAQKQEVMARQAASDRNRASVEAAAAIIEEDPSIKANIDFLSSPTDIHLNSQSKIDDEKRGKRLSEGYSLYDLLLIFPKGKIKEKIDKDINTPGTITYELRTIINNNSNVVSQIFKKFSNNPFDFKTFQKEFNSTMNSFYKP
jgi:hypothetical protein